MVAAARSSSSSSRPGRAALQAELKAERERTAKLNAEISRLAAVVAPPRWTSGQDVASLKGGLSRAFAQERAHEVPDGIATGEIDKDVAQRCYAQARNSAARNKALASGNGGFGRGLRSVEHLLQNAPL